MTPVIFLFLFLAFLASLDGRTSCDDYHHPGNLLRNHFRQQREPGAVPTKRKHFSMRGHQDLPLSSTFETGLLNILGMESRPRRRTRETVIPQLMIDLYWEKVWLASRSGRSRKSANQTKARDSPLHQSTADVIRSFFDTGIASGGGGNMKDADKSAVFLFDVADIAPDERLRGAELIVQRLCPPEATTNSTTSRDETSRDYVRPRRYRLSVLQPMRSHVTPGHVTRRLLDSRTMGEPRCGQSVSLDVRSAVVQWTRNPARNLGLVLELVPLGRGDVTGYITLPRLSRPILVAYTDLAVTATPVTSQPERHASPPPSRSRVVRHRKRSTGTQQRLAPYTDIADDVVPTSVTSQPERRASPPPHPHPSRMVKHRKRSTGKQHQQRAKSNRLEQQRHFDVFCQRRPLYIDFSDIGWDDWIVAPVGYTAHFCQGECPTFMHEYINYTNHAVIQSMVHSAYPQLAPRPCCVPTKLSTIPMLYVDSTSKVVLKNYKDMMVEACGCR